MKNSSRLLIGFIAAAITFGSLFALAGPERFARHHCYGPHRYEKFDDKEMGPGRFWHKDAAEKPGEKATVDSNATNK